MPGERFAAIIPAAGFSSRMGVFKPLLPLGSSLVIEETIDSLKLAGITDIRVVVGFKRKLLLPVLDRLSVRTVVNENFADGMYSSIKAGVSTLDDSTEAFFILPGDCPFVKPETISNILDAYRGNSVSVVYPTYGGGRGHPSLISTRLRSDILNSNPQGGLRALLEKKAANYLDVPVNDPGINYDMDTIKDYRNFSGKFTNFPSEEECLGFLQDAEANERVLRHSKEVARVALGISEHLNSRGCRINLGLVTAAGLLHDIARSEPNHDQKGAEIISGLGYAGVAGIIAAHTDIPPDAVDALGEAAIVYLADKMVKEDKPVTLDKRLSDSLKKFGHDKSAAGNISSRFDNAFKIKKKIEDILKIDIEDILQG